MVGIDFAVRGGKRRLIAGGGRQLVPTHFLSWASKKENALQKKEESKGNPSEGFPLDSFEKQRGRGPSDSPELLGRNNVGIFRFAS